MEHKDEWKHRRAMAWLSFFALIAIAFIALFKGDDLGSVASIVNTSQFAFTAIVSGYTGWATIDKWKGSRSTTGSNAGAARPTPRHGRQYETR